MKEIHLKLTIESKSKKEYFSFMKQLVTEKQIANKIKELSNLFKDEQLTITLGY